LLSSETLPVGHDGLLLGHGAISTALGIVGYFRSFSGLKWL
jgi:hypothetical protein